MFKLQRFVFNPLEENTYVLYDSSRECVIIDPGCYAAEEREELQDFVAENQLNVTKLLNTHGHVDHVLGNAFVKEKYKTKLYIHKKDEATLRAVKVYATHYGFNHYHDAEPDEFLEEGDVIKFGDQQLRVLFVPGHAPGHVAFYHAEQKVVIGGDVLFRNSIGRTDLPGGDFGTLIKSINEKFFTLPDDVIVYPGHGPETSIGFEKKTNPFCGLNAGRY